MWFSEFFSGSKLPKDAAQSYSVAFANNGMTWDLLPFLNSDHLKEMKITKVGHCITIIKHAEEVVEQVERKEALEHSDSSKKLSPVNRSPDKPRVINLKEGKCIKRPRELLHGPPKEIPTEVKKPKPLSADDEGLSVILPPKHAQSSVLLSNRLAAQPSPHPETRPSVKERLSNPQSLEVSSSTEKELNLMKINYPSSARKRSVFERLGRVATTSETPQSSNSVISDVKRQPTPSNPTPSPAAPPKPQPVVANEPVISRVLFHSPHDPSKVPARKLLKKESKDVKYGCTMAADFESTDEHYGRNGIHNRLGNRYLKQQPQQEVPNRKKKVSFGGVMKQEIPSVPGTVPVKQHQNFAYRGSIALGTFREIQ